MTGTNNEYISCVTSVKLINEEVNIAIIDLESRIGFDWSENSCSVTIKNTEEGVQFIAAGYENEKMITKAVILDKNTSTETFKGDTVKVFCWIKGKINPVREALISTRN